LWLHWDNQGGGGSHAHHHAAGCVVAALRSAGYLREPGTVEVRVDVVPDAIISVGGNARLSDGYLRHDRSRRD
jgi:hypothetical protein